MINFIFTSLNTSFPISNVAVNHQVFNAILLEMPEDREALKTDAINSKNIALAEHNSIDVNQMSPRTGFGFPAKSSLSKSEKQFY